MDVIDPATGLTERQKEAVRDSWCKITAQWKVNGLEFFFRLFRDYPEIRGYFKAFDNLNLEELRKSSKLRAHAINFKHGISSFVESLDEPEILVALVQKLAANHHTRQINNPKLFQDALNAFQVFVKEEYEFNTFTLDAWKITAAAIAGVIADHFKALQKEMDGEDQLNV